MWDNTTLPCLRKAEIKFSLGNWRAEQSLPWLGDRSSLAPGLGEAAGHGEGGGWLLLCFVPSALVYSNEEGVFV